MASKTIDVSVIIPVYNGEKSIQQMVEAVLAERRVSLELIVIDDGSTDNTLRILSSITDERLHVISQNNSGVYVARNTGLAAHQGKWLILLDADDEISPEMIYSRYQLAEEHRCDVLISNGMFTRERDQHNGRHVHTQQVYRQTQSGFEWINHAVKVKEWPHYIWLQIISSEYIKKHNIDFHIGSSHKDILWTTELALANGIFYVSEAPDYYYIKNTESITNHTRYYDPRAYSYIDIISKLIAYAKKPEYAAVRRSLLIQALKESGHFLGLYRRKIKDKVAVRQKFNEMISLADLAKGLTDVHSIWFLMRLWLKMRR